MIQNKNSAKFAVIPVGMLQTNCYLVKCDKSDTLYIIDPGDEADIIAAEAEKYQTDKITVLLTHGHFDHISALPELIKQTDIEEVYLNSSDKTLYKSSNNSIPPFSAPGKGLPETVDNILSDDFEIIETPGHTRGGVCFLFKEINSLFCGDTIFAGSVGRTDLPGASHEKLISSIRNKIMTLDENLKLYPGHGPSSTISIEKMNNPYF